MRTRRTSGLAGVARIALACAVGVAASACNDRQRRAQEGVDGGVRRPDAGVGTATTTRPTFPLDAGARCADEPARPIRELALLFIIDTSVTMAQEQARLAAALPALLRRLAPDDSGRVLRLGVVSSDLGLDATLLIEGCPLPGDDGLLQREGDVDPESGTSACTGREHAFVTHEAGRDEIERTVFELGCVVRLGTAGCGFEQTLESALRALWPKNALVPPGGPARGHGDGENAGFLDPDGDALLAVIALSDEDDCSHPDAHFLLPSSHLDDSDPVDRVLLTQGLRARCALNPGALYPIERYRDAWRALRGGRAERVFFATLAGAPPDAVAPELLAMIDLDDADARERFYAQLLDRPEMRLAIDGNGTPDPADDSLVPSCRTASDTHTPPFRLVRLARSFGAYGLVQSACQDDYGAAVEAIATRIDQLMAEPRCR